MTDANRGIKFYRDLITSSLDSKTLNHPDIQVLVNDFSDGNHAQVEIDCLMRINDDKTDSLAWSFLGLCLMVRKDGLGATATLMKAVAHDDKSVLALNLLGDCLCNRGKEKEGEVLYWDSLHLREEQVHPRKRLYFQLVSRNEYEKALQVLEPVLIILPDDSYTWRNIKVCISKMEPEGFAEKFATLLTDSYPLQYRGWYLQGDIFHNIGREKDAEKAVRKALELKEDDVLSWALLANILVGQERYQEAVDCGKRVTEIRPRDMNAWFHLSLLYLKTGEDTEWRMAVDNAISIDPQAARELLDSLEKQEGSSIEG
ncbi:MAG: tetratricopeptide repeat protein [Candidatus Thorarchaeota archaeon]